MLQYASTYKQLEVFNTVPQSRRTHLICEANVLFIILFTFSEVNKIRALHGCCKTVGTWVETNTY